MTVNHPSALDETDWAILAELQRDGRLPLTELGRRVSLSASAATERVKRLEAVGVITGYRAEVDLGKVGFSVLAVVRLKYPGSRHEPLYRLHVRVSGPGGAGVSDDYRLARAYASIRTLRLADGPDEVHRRAIARLELNKHR